MSDFMIVLLKLVNLYFMRWINMKIQEKPASQHSIQVQVAQISQHILPAPEVLQKYKEIDPNFPERIMQLAENFANTSIANEKTALIGKINEIKRSQVLGFSLGFITLGFATFVTWLGYPYVGGVIGGTTAIGLVTSFLRPDKK